MKSNVKLVKQGIKYNRASNDYSSEYNVYDAGYGVLVSADITAEDKWAERYRPKIIDDLILPAGILSKINDYINNKAKDILLYSPNGGTGKDSVAQVIKNATGADMLSINMSKDGNIATIRSKVVSFASTLSMMGDKKIINLGETGGMTKVAMDSLKGVMEEFSTNVTWIMTTNDLSNLPEPMETRFGEPINLASIPPEEKMSLAQKTFFRLKTILDIEEVEYDDKDVQSIMLKHFPSYRKLLVALDMAVQDGKLQPQAEVDIDSVNNIIKLLNECNYNELAGISEKIDLISFMNYMNSNYISIIQEASKIPDFIDSFNNLQMAVTRRDMFLNISFLVFCTNIINKKIKFK